MKQQNGNLARRKSGSRPLGKAAGTQWISTDERLPDDETPVLIFHRDGIRIGELRWERPTYEENFRAYRYWDDPENDGQDWYWEDVTHWMPLPNPPAVAPRQKE